MGYSPHEPQSPPPVATPLQGRRRRLPNPTEQERRKAWGREWGGMIGAYWKQRAASGSTTGRTRGPAI